MESTENKTESHSSYDCFVQESVTYWTRFFILFPENSIFWTLKVESKLFIYFLFQNALNEQELIEKMFRGKRLIRIRPMDEQEPVMYSRRSPPMTSSGNKGSSKPRYRDPLRTRVWQAWTNQEKDVVRVRETLIRAITREYLLSLLNDLNEHWKDLQQPRFAIPLEIFDFE